MFTEDWFRSKKDGEYAEIRRKGNTTIYVEEKDLAAEREYNERQSGCPKKIINLDDFKAFEISLVRSSNNSSTKLSYDEKHFLCFINPDRATSGQKVLDCLNQSHSEVKFCFDMGMAWCANDLTAIERLINSLPQVLDALVQKGLLSYINPNIENKKELSLQEDELLGLASLGI